MQTRRREGATRCHAALLPSDLLYGIDNHGIEDHGIEDYDMEGHGMEDYDMEVCGMEDYTLPFLLQVGLHQRWSYAQKWCMSRGEKKGVSCWKSKKDQTRIHHD